jgi:hypothetical protein
MPTTTVNMETSSKNMDPQLSHDLEINSPAYTFKPCSRAAAVALRERRGPPCFS